MIRNTLYANIYALHPNVVYDVSVSIVHRNPNMAASFFNQCEIRPSIVEHVSVVILPIAKIAKGALCVTIVTVHTAITHDVHVHIVQRNTCAALT